MTNKGKAIPGRVCLGSNDGRAEDEMVTWLQYPLEDTLERGYCSELFGRLSSSFGESKAHGDKAGLPNSREKVVSSTTMADNNEDELALGAGRASGFAISEGAEEFNKVKTRMPQGSFPAAQFGTSPGHESSHSVLPTSPQGNGEPLKLHPFIHPQGCSQTAPLPEYCHTYHGAPLLHNMWLSALLASANQDLQRMQFSNHTTALSSACGSSDVLNANTSKAGSDARAHEMNPRGSNYGCASENHVSLHGVSAGQREPAWTYSRDIDNFTRLGTPLKEAQGTAVSGDVLIEAPDAAPSCSGGSRSSAELSVKETCSVGKQKADDYDCQSKYAEVDWAAELSHPHKHPPKRRRAAESHNLSEKRRRNRINERLKTLQELIPNSTKTDKASILDEAIEYLKALQSQLQMMSSRSGMRASPVSVPTGMEQPQMAQMAPVHLVGLGVPYMHAGLGMGIGVMNFSQGVDGRTFQALSAVPPHCGPTYPMAAAVSPQARGQAYTTAMEAPPSQLWATQQDAFAQPCQPVYVESQALSSVEMHQQDEGVLSSRDSKDR